MNLRPPSDLTDAELEVEIKTLARLASPLGMATDLDPHFQIRGHVKVISRALVDIFEGRIDRLLITTPPQVGKSQSAAVWGPLWWLTNNPRHRIIVGSYSDDLAVRRGKQVRSLIEEHGKTLGLQLEYGSTAAKDWSLTVGGGMRSVGIGSGITGHSADLLLIDDPHKDRAEAESLRIRENVWDWVSSSAFSRLAPGAPVILIMTRWHTDDIAGRLLDQEGRTEDGGRWKVVHMPAICDNPKTDPLHRKPGQPLPHPKIPDGDTKQLLEHWEDKRRTTSVRDWHALYQGNPKPAEGALVTAELLRAQRMYQPTATPTKHAVAVDPSGGGRDTAGIIGGWLGDDQKLYITHDRTLIGSADDWSRAACVLAADTNSEKIVVESNYGGDMARLVIRTAWDQLKRENPNDPKYQRIAPMIEMVHAKKGKLLRAEPIAQQIKEDNIRFATYMPELEQEWASWMPTDPDSPGRIDASVHLAYALLPVPGSEIVVSSPARISRRSMTGAQPAILGRR